MLSGNGRHRRPRQAPALVVAAGVTGSAIAIPLLGATGAHAADGTTWDRVAECETGGAWSQNGGNGYYGGLQMSQEDWEAYGGLAYATSADQASRSQQIRVAEKLLAAQGIAAWPTCGLLAGLDGSASDDSSESATSDTDSGDSSSSSGSSGSSDSSASSDASDSTGSSADSSTGSGSDSGSGSGSSASPSATDSTDSSDSADSTDSGDESSKSGTSSESASPTGEASDAPTTKSDTAGIGDSADNLEPSPGTSSLTDTGAGRHRGGSADDETASGRSESASGRHASRDDETARDAGDGTYTVRAGDNLWAIADSLDLAGGWSSLYAENKDTVGADPDHILPGQKLAVGVEPVEKQR
ncbi:transglycosylase family protein [Streptomyces sp. NPDC023723]|uniref:transglycosylase family protein n=1 Tax=Streptomyces sp. NPDC023723 TaxID=3154323 RepID=UPI00340753D5